MGKFSQPEYVPDQLEEPRLTVPNGQYIRFEYDDGVVAIYDQSGQVETRFPDGGIHFEYPHEDDGPNYIADGH
jgi:hypothetical protein